MYDNIDFLQRYRSTVTSEHFDICTTDGRNRLIMGGVLPQNSPLKSTVVIVSESEFVPFIRKLFFRKIGSCLFENNCIAA